MKACFSRGPDEMTPASQKSSPSRASKPKLSNVPSTSSLVLAKLLLLSIEDASEIIHLAMASGKRTRIENAQQNQRVMLIWRTNGEARYQRVHIVHMCTLCCSVQAASFPLDSSVAHSSIFA
jgi:hypothetical protein